MILLPTPDLRLLHHPPPPPTHPLHSSPPPPPPPPQYPPPIELARPEVVGNATRTMPESSGDVEVLSPPRIHLASRRRFDLKLDLASALSGRQEKKRARLDVLTAPALLSPSRLSPDTTSAAMCGGGSPGCVPGLQASAYRGGKDSTPSSASSSTSSPVLDFQTRDSRPLFSASGLPMSPCVGQQHPACLGHHHHHHQQQHSSSFSLGQQQQQYSAGSCLLGLHSCLGQQQQQQQQQQLQQQLQQTAMCVEHHHHHNACTFRASPRATQDRTIGGGGGVGSPMSTSSPLSSLGGGGVLPPSFRVISGVELAGKLRKGRPGLVIDCRPFLCYNAQHVQGALNISCTDRFNRKRLQQGKVGVLDLLASTHGKDTFRRRPVREVVLYDERGDVGAVGVAGGGGGGGGGGGVPLESDSALHIVLTTLLREGRQPAVLQGGMKQFEAEHPELVWSSKKTEVPGRLLCSPTNDTVEPEIETATASRVLPFLYLGNERDAADLEGLRRHNITYVLNVTAHVPHYCYAHGIRYKRIPASDSAQQNLKQYFEEAIDYIDEARQKGASVLIHCHAGVSRSATITIAYILKHSKMPMSDAYKYVKGKRGIISPNFNFLGQLLEFEQDLNQDVSQRVLSPRLLEPESGATATAAV